MSATIDGFAIMTGDILVTDSEIWTAEIEPHDDAELERGQAVKIQIGDLSLSGTIVFGTMGIANSSFFVVGGAAGWRKPVLARAYQDDSGVRLSAVAGDLAAEVGETLSIVAEDRLLGSSWVRFGGPASEALRALGEPWRVRPDGVTELGPRATVDVSEALISMRSTWAAAGRVYLDFAEDEIAAVTPGHTIDLGEVVMVARQTRILISNRTVRAEVDP